MAHESVTNGTTSFVLSDHPHIRQNPLTGAWLLVSPQRFKRPWTGHVEKSAGDEDEKEWDPKNPLCPGVTRASGKITPNYTSTYVFTNDFPALFEDGPDSVPSDDLFTAAPARGTCRVVCFHPKSNVTIPLMSQEEVKAVIDTWIKEYADLSNRLSWVQIFENRGIMMGCSNPHPHSQIWACDFLPNIPRIKTERQREYFKKHGRPMLMDYVKQELEKNERIVVANATWVVVVPFWAEWPYETMVLPRSRHIPRLTDLSEEEKAGLADIMRKITTKYDNLFQRSFPFTFGIHGAPTAKAAAENPGCEDYWQLHALYFPPLLLSATVRKFMAGFEMLAQTQRDLTPEEAARRLRATSDLHYKFAARNKKAEETNGNIEPAATAVAAV